MAAPRILVVGGGYGGLVGSGTPLKGWPALVLKESIEKRYDLALRGVDVGPW